ncbi:Uncharacterized membrane protein YckC, RDD family [Micromonospora nigra]|uniref:Uncharacterized membrane protein YckC, RDD family n=1 Tax=Micromonospora nigra TaxID=145857 RepID=A0A1C6SFU1_9ACTN|nr:Uncharacterized membrane protein YckC, RDD family [Micromonospora nigra]
MPGWGDAGLVSGDAVGLDVRAARIGSRVLALLLDILLQALAALLLVAVAGMALAAMPYGLLDGALSNAALTVGLVLVLVGYPVLFERLNDGRTPGKMAVGLRVVSVDGARVGLRQSLTRALVGVAVEWPGLILPLLSWVAGVTVMLSDRRGRRLGDLVAGTQVVHVRTAAAWRPVPTAVPALAGWAYTLDLSRLDDALALAARQYLARIHQFAEPARGLLARGLWTEVAAVTTPPPPAGMPEPVYLAAVLGERHRRARERLGHERAVMARLWPELTPAPPPAPDPAPTPATPLWVRPAVPPHPVPPASGVQRTVPPQSVPAGPPQGGPPDPAGPPGAGAAEVGAAGVSAAGVGGAEVSAAGVGGAHPVEVAAPADPGVAEGRRR